MWCARCARWWCAVRYGTVTRGRSCGHWGRLTARARGPRGGQGRARQGEAGQGWAGLGRTTERELQDTETETTAEAGPGRCEREQTGCVSECGWVSVCVCVRCELCVCVGQRKSTGLSVAEAYYDYSSRPDSISRVKDNE